MLNQHIYYFSTILKANPLSELIFPSNLFIAVGSQLGVGTAKFGQLLLPYGKKKTFSHIHFTIGTLALYTAGR